MENSDSDLIPDLVGQSKLGENEFFDGGTHESMRAIDGYHFVTKRSVKHISMSLFEWLSVVSEVSEDSEVSEVSEVVEDSEVSEVGEVSEIGEVGEVARLGFGLPDSMT